MGQSNIQGWFDGPSQWDAMPAVYSMAWDAEFGAVPGSAAVHFAENDGAELNVPALIVQGAKGGLALLEAAGESNGHWMSTASGLRNANVLQLLEQVGGQAEIVLRELGETDAFAGMSQCDYAAALTQFMGPVLADFGPDRVLIQEIGPRGDNSGRYDGFRAAQHAVAAALAGVDLGSLTLGCGQVQARPNTRRTE